MRRINFFFAYTIQNLLFFNLLLLIFILILIILQIF